MVDACWVEERCVDCVVNLVMDSLMPVLNGTDLADRVCVKCTGGDIGAHAFVEGKAVCDRKRKMENGEVMLSLDPMKLDSVVEAVGEGTATTDRDVDYDGMGDLYGSNCTERDSGVATGLDDPFTLHSECLVCGGHYGVHCALLDSTLPPKKSVAGKVMSGDLISSADPKVVRGGHATRVGLRMD